MRRTISFFALFLLAFPLVAAQFAPSLDSALNDGFRAFFDLITEEYTQFGLVIIFMIILFTNIFNAGLMRVAVFGGSGGTNKYGKMVSVSFAILSTLGLMFFSERSPLEMMEAVMTVGGWMAAFALSLLAFGLTYFNLKGERKSIPISLIAAGIGLFMFGSLSLNDSYIVIGLLLILLGIIFALFSGNKSNGNKSNDGSSRSLWDRFRRKNKVPPSGAGDTGGDSTARDTQSTQTPERITGVNASLAVDTADQYLLKVSWDRAVRVEVETYEIRYESRESKTEVITISQLSDPASPSVSLGVNPEPRYWVQVRGRGRNGEAGEWSGKVEAVINVPATPSGITGVLMEDGQ